MVSDLATCRIAVVGGGAIGLATALSAVRRGAQVTLYERQPSSLSASAVAAGMLSPAFEAVLDPLSAGHYPLLRAARDLWPGFIETLRLPVTALDRSGALWAARRGEDGELQSLTGRLLDAGASAERVTAERLGRLHPTLASGLIGAVMTPDDWTLDPHTVLEAMNAAYRRAGGRLVHDEVHLNSARLFAGSVLLEADAMVLAAGPGGIGLAALAPELVMLQPIKGQILHFVAGPQAGPVVRHRRGYLVPQPRGAIVGATMEVGVADRNVDADAVAELRTEAAALFPHLVNAPATGLAAVRVSTPDGLPLAGASSRPGVLLALGARRNGWLLAPMVADVIAAALLGGPPAPYGAVLDARRFASADRI